MRVEIEKCAMDSEQITVSAKFIATFESIATEEQGHYRYENLQKEAETIIATAIAEEFLKQHKMEIVKSLSKEDIVSGIQLKMIQDFGLGQRT